MKNLIKTKPAVTLFTIVMIITASTLFLMTISNKKLSASNQEAKILFAEDSHDF